MDKYRLTKQDLWDILEAWEPFLPRQVRLVACGGTALTLQDLKESTKDVDFLVPDEDEYKAVLSTIQKLNYRQVTGSGWARDGGFTFDLFPGKTVFKTELLDSPLDEGRYIPIRTIKKKLLVGALNDHDLIISKMFRGTEVDVDDCLMLIKGRKEFDFEQLKDRFKETAQYDIRPEEKMKNLDWLLAAFEERK
jgi:hypothetical protein